MNCCPDDLAVVVRATTGRHCNTGKTLLGTVVTVSELFDSFDGPAWFIKSPQKCVHCGAPVFAFLDADLQPQRPRGPQASVDTDRPLEVVHG